jgi:hypothetical protein
MTQPPRRRPFFSLGLLIGVAAVVAYRSLPPPALPMPADESAFIRAVADARAAKTGMRQARAAVICQAIPTRTATGWMGRIVSVEPNTLPDFAGKTTARVVIALDAHLRLATPSNPVMNLPGSMIEAGTPLYEEAATLRAGQAIMFSGKFSADGADCVAETSFLTDGSMREPVFRIELEDIKGK